MREKERKIARDKDPNAKFLVIVNIFILLVDVVVFVSH